MYYYPRNKRRHFPIHAREYNKCLFRDAEIDIEGCSEKIEVVPVFNLTLTINPAMAGQDCV